MIALGVIADPAHSVGGLRLNQWVALGAVLAGAIYLLATRGRKWDESRLTMEPHGVAEEST